MNSRIIENIITCANVFYLKSPSLRSIGQHEKRRIYIDAYKELVIYLKYLFVYFDKTVEINHPKIEKWHWAIFFKILSERDSIEKVNIVTFNYDLWLERILYSLNIKYNVSTMSTDTEEKFTVIKPHGSISFVHKQQLDSTAFNVNYDNDFLMGEPKDFEIKMNDLDVNTPIIPLIPPAGDSERLNQSWAGSLRNDTIEKAKSLSINDNVILCGLSYWHVDRREIDNILMGISDKINVTYINPVPPETFDAVLTSLFNNYVHYTTMERYMLGNFYE